MGYSSLSFADGMPYLGASPWIKAMAEFKHGSSRLPKGQLMPSI